MKGVTGICVVVASCAGGAQADILVYDQNSINQYALKAAENLQPGKVTRATTSIGSLLTSKAWDVVAIDCPSNYPTDGWAPLVDYVKAGGRVVTSFWDWDAQPALRDAFGATGTSTFSLVGRTYSATAEGTALGIFDGVTMPHSAWSDFWADDGDGFGFTLGGGTIGLGTMSGIADPVTICANEGRTIGTFVHDEWIGADAVTVWENMMTKTVPAPASLALLGLGALAAGRRRA